MFLLLMALLLAAWPLIIRADADASAQTAAAPPHAQQTPEQLQQLVAPIALYPDSLVAQILAASTFPEQVVLAERWVQQNPGLKGAALGQALDQQSWDPSVKAVAAFPAILGNMDKNLGWTSSLGDAYYNQQQDVMQAVQVMRQRAQAAGNLKSTSQETVSTQDSTIAIQPASPDVVYVPAYDPWLIYGDLVPRWPYWVEYPGIWFDGPYVSFGIGFDVGFFGGFSWGWGRWGFDWGHRYPLFGGGRYFSHSNTFFNRGAYYRGGGQHGVESSVVRGTRDAGAARAGAERGNAGHAGRAGTAGDPFGGRSGAARGYSQPRGESGVRSGAFSGYNHGGPTREFSSRGSSSFGGGRSSGGGGSHSGGGGGGGHGGGGHGGGRPPR